MARTVPSGYSTEVANSNLKPCVIMSVSGLTRRYSNTTFNNITANDKKLIKQFEATLLGINVKEGRIIPGQASSILVNSDTLDVSEQLIVDNNIHRQEITYDVGFQELDDTDFVSIPGHYVKTMNHLNVNDIQVITTDAKRFITDKDTLFNFSFRTNLTSAMTASATTANVDSTTGAASATAIDTENNVIRPAIVVGNREVMFYSGTTATTFTVSRSSDTGGGFPIEHFSEDEVVQAVVFNDNPNNVELTTGPGRALLAVLMTRREAGTATHSFYDFTTFDSAYEGMGLGLTSSEININSFEVLDGILRHAITDQTTEYGGRIAVGWQSVNAQQWITNFLKSYGAFLYVDANGLLAVKVWDRIELEFNETSATTLDDDDIREGSKFNIRFDELLNYVEIAYGLNHLTGIYTNRRQYRLTDSVTAYTQNERPFIIEMDGLPDAVNDDEMEIFVNKFLWTFADPPGFFTINTGLEHIGVAAGDVITVTCTRFLDYSGSNASQGWSSMRCLVTGQRIVWSGETPNITLEGFCWGVMDKTDISTDLIEETYPAASWDDTSISIGNAASNSVTLEAQDAYIDISPFDSSQLFRVEVTITPPASPTNPDTEIVFDLALHAQNPAGTDQFEGIYRSVRYNTDDAAFNLVFYFTQDGAVVNYVRLKVDAFDGKNTSDASAADAGDLATLTIVSVNGYNYNALGTTEIT